MEWSLKTFDHAHISALLHMLNWQKVANVCINRKPLNLCVVTLCAVTSVTSSSLKSFVCSFFTLIKRVFIADWIWFAPSATDTNSAAQVETSYGIKLKCTICGGAFHGVAMHYTDELMCRYVLEAVVLTTTCLSVSRIDKLSKHDFYKVPLHADHTSSYAITQKKTSKTIQSVSIEIQKIYIK